MSGLSSGWRDEGARPQRDTHRLIANPLEVAVDLDPAHQKAQIRGHRLPQGELRETAVIDLDAQEVHFFFMGQDRLHQGRVAIDQRLDPFVNHRLGQTSHGQQTIAESM